MLKEKRWDSSIAIMVIASLVLISFGVSIWFSDFIEDISTVMSASSKIIIIDAGHGGEDAGAVARDDIYEKDAVYHTGNCPRNCAGDPYAFPRL